MCIRDSLKEAKKPRSGVDGDIPREILIEYMVELAKPVSFMWNKILETQNYPEQWKRESTIVIPKVNPPTSKDDLRNISLTPFLSKCFEGQVVIWLWESIKHKWDPGQFGSRKGSSTAHYIIYLIDFIMTNWENNKKAVLLLLLDWSKGFNRIDHTRLVTILADLSLIHI